MDQHQNKIKGLTGFRGVACLIVILSHAGHAGLFEPGILNPKGIGNYGVVAFFLLSGLLMVETIERGQAADRWVRFFWRRVLRIYPMYIFTLSLFVVAGMSHLENFGVSRFLEGLLLIEGYRHLWAIPVEFSFYMVFPFFYWVFTELRPQVHALLMLGLMVVLAFGVVAPERYSLINYLPVFYVGMNLSRVRAADHGKSTFRAQLVLVILPIALLVAMFPGVFHALTGRAVVYDFLHGYPMLVMIPFCLLIMAIIRNEKGSGLFKSKFLGYFGERSYSIYLMHPFVLAAVKKLFLPGCGVVVSLTIFLLASVAISEITFRLIEKRFYRFS